VNETSLRQMKLRRKEREKDDRWERNNRHKQEMASCQCTLIPPRSILPTAHCDATALRLGELPNNERKLFYSDPRRCKSDQATPLKHLFLQQVVPPAAAHSQQL
jgi:hypothetical protein